MRLQKLLSYVRSAADDYGMIAEGDRIGVGVSGGKDSLTLLTALHELQRFYPKKFDLCAVTVSIGFSGFDHESVTRFCDSRGITHRVVETDIADVVFNIRKEKNPCSLCANMRRGALHNALVGLGCNKAALGHNRDDVIETFFLSLFYEGRAQTFQPVTYLDRTGVTVIRPLIYTPDSEIRSFIRAYDIQPVSNPCPVDGSTKRAHIRRFIADMAKEHDSFQSKMMNAVFGLSGWERSRDGKRV